MSYYIKCIKNYVNFEGRARRREYWFFYLFNMIIYTLLALPLLIDPLSLSYGFTYRHAYSIISIIYGLFILLPSLAVLVRRLHDIGKSGAWGFITFVPFIGGLWLLILTLTDSQSMTNVYGPNPKAEDYQ